jgi:transposase
VRFIGGELQQGYVEQTRDLEPSRCLAAGIDVGKYEALCLVADHRGEVVGEPLVFALNERGVVDLERRLTAARQSRRAVSLRVGVETAGHYHRTVVSRLVGAGHDVVELNPGHVKAVRSAQGFRTLKNDLRDAAAIVDLVISGAGRAPQQRCDALVEQQVWAMLRRRRLHARSALGNQLLGTLDLVFPGLDGCFEQLLSTKVGPVLLRELADPDRMHRLGMEGLRRFTARRGVVLHRSKAARLHQAAADALRLPAAERACRAEALAADLALLEQIDSQIQVAEQHLHAVLPDTPAGVLTTLPGIGVVRASNYGAALGDPLRFGNAEQAYRFSGLVPATHESAGRSYGEPGISRDGSSTLRDAIVELGRGLAQHDSDFARYRAGLLARGMKPLPAAIAVGHRAHRLAFALMRSGQPYDPDRLAQSVASGGERRKPKAGGPVKELHREAACRHDVTHPPSTTVPRQPPRRKIPIAT